MIPMYAKVRRHFYGLLIELNGRPKGRNRTVTYRMREGAFATQAYRQRVNIGYGIAKAKIGVFGIRTCIAY